MSLSLEASERELAGLRDNEGLRESKPRLRPLERALESARHALVTLQRRCDSLAARLRTQACARRDLQFSDDALQAQVQALHRHRHGDAPGTNQSAGADACGNLCGRRIAYIGGTGSSVSQLRAAVEKRNGEFHYHDAGFEDGAEGLRRVLGKAQWVFCPVDHVSHAACLCAKRFCQRNARQFVPLRSAGLTTFLRGLEAVAKDTAN